ncbi:MAG: cation:dicarboxylase symporter family transporter [Enterocloster sp.]|nr:cation:dicarboxylase symporter family transporter [Enterocloster sp.]
MQLDACDKLGVPRVVSSVVVPVGATCHMAGACLATIYEIVLCCTLFGHPFRSIGDYAFALTIAVCASVAVSSVPGGGAAMLVSRFLYGKDWYKRDLNKELAEAENKE